jgi:hypothetical protein
MIIQIFQKDKEIFDPETNLSLGILEYPVLNYGVKALEDNSYHVLNTNVYIRIINNGQTNKTFRRRNDKKNKRQEKCFLQKIGKILASFSNCIKRIFT